MNASANGPLKQGPRVGKRRIQSTRICHPFDADRWALHSGGQGCIGGAGRRRRHIIFAVVAVTAPALAEDAGGHLDRHWDQ